MALLQALGDLEGAGQAQGAVDGAQADGDARVVDAHAHRVQHRLGLLVGQRLVVGVALRGGLLQELRQLAQHAEAVGGGLVLAQERRVRAQVGVELRALLQRVGHRADQPRPLRDQVPSAALKLGAGQVVARQVSAPAGRAERDAQHALGDLRGRQRGQGGGQEERVAVGGSGHAPVAKRQRCRDKAR